MAFSLKMQKTSKQTIEEKVREAARLLEIEGLLFRKPKELSGGQRQRVAIGRAIVRKPKLFLFDEPLSNLDAKLRTAMRVELAGLHRKLGSTMVYVTHDQTEAMTLGQKIILLNEGRIQQIGTPEDVYERPANTFVAGFIGSPQMNFLEGSLVREKETLSFHSGAMTLDLSSWSGMRDYTGKSLTMGIRPESLIPGDGPVRAKIEFVEHLGAETILYAHSGDVSLTARVLSDFDKKAGDEVTFSLQRRGTHLFHEGRNILFEKSPDPLRDVKPES
jgi:multiple sugar transport system ATP-binding protein